MARTPRSIQHNAAALTTAYPSSRHVDRSRSRVCSHDFHPGASGAACGSKVGRSSTNRRRTRSQRATTIPLSRHAANNTKPITTIARIAPATTIATIAAAVRAPSNTPLTRYARQRQGQADSRNCRGGSSIASRAVGTVTHKTVPSARRGRGSARSTSMTPLRVTV